MKLFTQQPGPQDQKTSGCLQHIKDASSLGCFVMQQPSACHRMIMNAGCDEETVKLRATKAGLHLPRCLKGSPHIGHDVVETLMRRIRRPTTPNDAHVGRPNDVIVDMPNPVIFKAS
eukprot:350799-Chlamydomonas_euryale.AAC.2